MDQKNSGGPSLEDALQKMIVDLTPKILGDNLELHSFQWDKEWDKCYGKEKGRKRIIVPADKKVYSILGGFNAKFNIQVTSPTIIVIGCGINNQYEIKKSRSFKEKVGLITGVGHNNVYLGADIISIYSGLNKYPNGNMYKTYRVNL